MQTNAPGGLGTWAVYALIGVVLFGVGGVVLEDAMGGDWLTFIGCVCIAGGLVGIVAGGVSLGSSSQGSSR